MTKTELLYQDPLAAAAAAAAEIAEKTGVASLNLAIKDNTYTKPRKICISRHF